jgi:hypothetical protein
VAVVVLASIVSVVLEIRRNRGRATA